MGDADADVVYISDRLEPRRPELVTQLRSILHEHEIPLRVIRGTSDIWCRDFMPVQVGWASFVQFRFNPDYLEGYQHLITHPSQIASIPEIKHCQQSDIVLDGGNVVRWGNRCILTDKIFLENPRIESSRLLSTLRELLLVHDLFVIPQEPLDLTGHADGVVRFLDAGTVAINRYAEIAAPYGKKLITVLRQAGLDWLELPYKPKNGKRGEMPPAFGCYVNFLRVRDLIIVPVYGICEDDDACRRIEQSTPGTKVVPVNCRKLSMEGGVLNCVTWTFRSGGGRLNK